MYRVLRHENHYLSDVDRNWVSRKKVIRVTWHPSRLNSSTLIWIALRSRVFDQVGTAQPAVMAEEPPHCAWRGGQQTALRRGGGGVPRQVGCAGPSPCKTSICLATWLNKREKESRPVQGLYALLDDNKPSVHLLPLKTFLRCMLSM